MKSAAGRAAQWGVSGAAALFVLSGCIDTRYDSSISSETTVAATTTLPTGPARELLPRLVATAAALSAAITANDNDRAIAADAQALWNAAQQEVAANRPELLGGFESNVADLAEAARFNRAADADKAFKNLQALVDSYLASP